MKEPIVKFIVMGPLALLLLLAAACGSASVSDDATFKACYAGGYLQGSGTGQTYEAIQKSLGLQTASSDDRICLDFYKQGLDDARQSKPPRY